MKVGLGIALVTLAACGGSDGSGVSGDKTLVSLTSSEQEDVCAYILDAQGGAGATIECGDNVTITIDTVAECVAGWGDLQASCTATVSDAEACADAMGADPCDFTGLPEACGFLIECFGQQ